ncbi:MAG: hypothetical protein Q4E73_03465 [Lachnospiraceae bacterium]|nr:hypothetical protein [Lachnospiraceae bacterium]
MWGMIAAAVVYAVAIGFNVGKEGMRQNRNRTEWTMEEIDKIKGSAVMGWKLLIAMLLIAGAALLVYEHFFETDKALGFWWIQISCALFTAAVISVGLLLYAKKNPTIYKIICIMKPEKEIRPTVAQRVESGMKGIWEENFPERKPDMTDLTAAYYKAKENSDNPTTQDLMKQYKESKKEDSFETEKKIMDLQSQTKEKSVLQSENQQDDYYQKYVELLEKYANLLEKYNELKQDN